MAPNRFMAAAQYQQQPEAPGGAMIKRVWVRRYDQLPKSGQIIQSWDVANKQGEENDYSVCTTWLIYVRMSGASASSGRSAK
jgi:phage terminase large subunit-like protein